MYDGRRSSRRTWCSPVGFVGLPSHEVKGAGRHWRCLGRSEILKSTGALELLDHQPFPIGICDHWRRRDFSDGGPIGASMKVVWPIGSGAG